MKLTPLLLSLFLLISCQENTVKYISEKEYELAENETNSFEIDTTHYSDELIVVQVAPNTYQHISYLHTQDFGKVACNGMIVVQDNESIVFDTPANEESSEQLMAVISNHLKIKIVALIPTHYHADCVGGIQAFLSRNIPIYASNHTIEFLKNKDADYVNKIQGFQDSLTLKVGQEKVYAQFHGAGHTYDNIVGYFPLDKILFGGCLVKEMGADKGNLEDANVEVWSHAIENLKAHYPQLHTIIPGHGKPGGLDLLDYTASLFQQ